ncbi:MAG: SLBB domain-containing protein [candidate division WOR-3 bacterium]|nr:MAG: SLBB domain-containing protein [candidate division WOR-3 bacterium]
MPILNCGSGVKNGVRLGFVGLLVLTGLSSVAGAQAEVKAPEFKYYVWGQVNSPGAYSLGANPDLVELLSAAGGPTRGANLRRVVLVKAVNRRRMKINVHRMLSKGVVVPLSPGDVVIVPRSFWFTIRDEFWVVTTAATLVNLGLTIYALAGSGE